MNSHLLTLLICTVKHGGGWRKGGLIITRKLNLISENESYIPLSIDKYICLRQNELIGGIMRKHMYM